MNKKLTINIIIVVIMVISIVSIYLYKTKSSKSEDVDVVKVENSTTKQLEQSLENNNITMVQFTTPTCINCKEMEPTMNTIYSKYGKKANVLVIDLMSELDLSKKYNIMYVPTQIFFDSKGKAVFRNVGKMSAEQIEQKLTELGV